MNKGERRTNLTQVIKFATVCLCMMTFSTVLYAQYPKIPPEVSAAAREESAKYTEGSRLVQSKAVAVAEKEAELYGRIYVPQASKPEDLVKASIPAFPGAEGAGAYTPGGRGGRVIVVTNLEDSGPGSLRDACEQGGARIVVFNVSGIIKLNYPITVSAPYITVAGQSAPGDGICIAGATFSISTHDVILRHLRFRRGETHVMKRDDAVGGNPVGNIMIDHCSASWGLDENISFYRHMHKGNKLPTVNVTIQNTISSEALDTYNHAFGSTIGGENCTFMRNLWACNVGRNPSVGMGGDFNMVNCVIFNWWNRTMDGGDNTSMWNVIGNYYKPGPITPEGEIQYRICKPETGRDENNKTCYGKVYVKGNVVEGYDKVTADNWDGGVQPETGMTPELLKSMRVDEPFPMAPMTIMTAKEAYKYVLENAGATWPKRDPVDVRVVKTVITGKPFYIDGTYEETKFVTRRLSEDCYKDGIIYDVAQVGGYPEYVGTPYTDKDNDGMPDAWEKKYGLDPNDPSDAVKDCNGDGYTNIEKFLNGLNPKKKIDWTLPENNYDRLAKMKAPLYGTNK